MAQNTTGPGVVLLNWNQAFAPEGISHYRVYLDGEIIGNTLGDIGNYTVHNLPFYVELSFKVKAITNSFRVSQESNTVKITLPTAGEPHLLNYKLNFTI
jgi:hypothetical protein